MINKQLINIMQYNPDATYDFICDHYPEFSKDELVAIIKELLFALRNDPELVKEAGDTLRDAWYYYYENEF